MNATLIGLGMIAAPTQAPATLGVAYVPDLWLPSATNASEMLCMSRPQQEAAAPAGVTGAARSANFTQVYVQTHVNHAQVQVQRVVLDVGRMRICSTEYTVSVCLTGLGTPALLT